MLQWAIWKHLAPKLVMDPERMQRLAEVLATEFHDEGVRMPLEDDPVETAVCLQAELLTVSAEIGPTAMTHKALRERTRIAAQKLYQRGWRRFVPAPAA
jgi:hypothetical protein